MSMRSLFEELNRAVKSGNRDEIDKIKRQILLCDRDKSIDKNFINSIDGKALYKNMKKVIMEDDSLSSHDYAKIVSSLITHAVIESEKTGVSYDEYGLNELYVLLGRMIRNEDGAEDGVKNFVTSRYSEFIFD